MNVASFNTRLIRAFLAGVISITSAFAQEKIVTIQGRKASAEGLLVRIKDGANLTKSKAAKGRLGELTMKTKAEFRAKGLMLVGKDAKTQASALMTSAELEKKAKELMATGLYDYVEPDWIVTVNQTPTDTAFANGALWGLKNTGQNGGVSGVDVNAQAAWALNTGSQSVIVGVVDTGIRYTHQDLVGNMWINSGEIAGNGIDDDVNGYVDDVHGINAIANSGNPMDDNDHGTHCAGTIGATANDSGQIVGVAWNVKLMALKFLSASGSGATSDAIKCIDYGVSKGAHILSNSWGGGGSSIALQDSIAAASASGVLFVAAAGNDSSNNDTSPNYPSNYDSENVVAVAAVDRTGAMASFSNFGASTVDLAAPGVEILSSTAASDTSYSSFSGTSMATPHVAGVAALIKSHFPTATMQEIKSRLLFTTRPLASLDGRTVSGGTVDAHAALTAAADGVLELRVAAANNPLRSGENTAFYVTVTDLLPVTGATVTGAFHADAPIPFLDNGISPDARANDGVYSANFLVPSTGSSATLNVTASNGGAPVIGAFPFQITAPPANDHFANRILLAAGTTRTTGTNQLSTFESEEPRFPSVAGSSSVWWEWAAGSTGSVTVTTASSNFDTTLAVYSGNGTLISLQHLGSNDDSIGLTSSVTFSATSGQRYYFQVNGFGSSVGNITLNYPSPANVNSPPVIVTQPQGDVLVVGDALNLSVSVSGTAPFQYQWILDGADIPAATTAAYSVASVTSADQGNYSVRITNAFGSITSATAVVGVDPISVRPVNDLFANAEPLAGASGRVSGSNLRASGESGEPNHAGASTPIESVWYRWTAPADGTLSLNTYGSSLDTTLAVYTGATINALTQKAANNDSGGVQSFVSLAVITGEVLHIAVDGAGTAESLFLLNYFFQGMTSGLANDAFANRLVVSGAGGTFTGSNISATGEEGEPVHEVSAPPTESVWWSWTAPANGVAVIDTLGSDFDTTLAVYTGENVTSLTQVASNDDAGDSQSRLSFPCTAGTAYAIAVDGKGTAQGLIALSITSGNTEPEIAVEQPVGAELVDGASEVSWGDVATGETVIRSFLIRNHGAASLTGLSVSIEGINAPNFELVSPPTSTLVGGAITTFSIRFRPIELSSHTAVLRITSNDSDEHPFDLSLSGNGVFPTPEIVVEQHAGVELVDGSAVTNFGITGIGSNSARTYTVKNSGNAPLSGLAVSCHGEHAGDFILIAPPANTLAPGESTSFRVSFIPGALGLRRTVLSIFSDDADENPFDVHLIGEGVDGFASHLYANVGFPQAGMTIDDETGDLYVAEQTEFSRLMKVAADREVTQVRADFSPIFWPYVATEIEFYDGNVWVNAFSQIRSINSNTGSTVDYQGGNPGTDAGATQRNGELYFSNSSGGMDGIWKFSPLTGITSLWASSDLPLYTLEYDEANDLIWARDLDYNLRKFHGNSGEFLGEIQAYAGTDQFAIEPSGTYAYQISGSDIERIDLTSGERTIILRDVVTSYGFNGLVFGASSTGGTSSLYYQNGDTIHEVPGFAPSSKPPTEPPVITSSLASSAYVGNSFSYRIRASRSPTSYDATELPDWLSIDRHTGQLSGTPTHPENFSIHISATNAVGTTTQTLTISVRNLFATVSVFVDSNYVNPSGAHNLQTSLARLDCNVTTFTGTSVADWNTAFASSQVLVIPRLDSPLFIGEAEKQAINQHLAAGKALVMTGTYFHNGEFLNRLREWTLGGWHFFENVTLNKTMGVPNFENSPATLQAAQRTYLTPQYNLPSSIQRVYDYNAGGLSAAFISGHIGSLGYDWTSGPNSDWDTVLKDMIASAMSYVSAPEIILRDRNYEELQDGLGIEGSFGITAVGSENSAFLIIQNDGFADLTDLEISIDGANAEDFALVGSPSPSLAPTNSITIELSFSPSAAGARTATLHIASNDADEASFDINLEGDGYIHAPEITVEQPVQTVLTDGDSTVNFGQAAEPVSRVFAVRNDGGQNLSISSLSINGANAADFSISEQPPSSLAPDESANFIIQFSPSALGQRTAALRITNDDADENPFDIALTATAITPVGGLDDFLPPALVDRNPLAEPHHDGVPNLLKYAFNLNPDAPDRHTIAPGGNSGLPAVGFQAQGNVFRFEYLRRLGSGLIYTAEKSGSLSSGSWTTLESPPQVFPINETWERVIHEEPVNVEVTPGCFGRVRVEMR